MTEVTHGHLLNGRVRYAQPARGFRSGIEPVLLAASIAARAGHRVLEGGTGAGPGLLCLLFRVPGVEGIGIERDPGQAALARENAAANGMTTLTVVTGDLAAAVPAGTFDHAFANPPYHAPSGTLSPNESRTNAMRGGADLLVDWARALAKPLRLRGTLTLILPPASLPVCLTAMALAGCQADAVLPLWPKAGLPAKLMIVRGIKGGRSPLRLLPGLVLHEADGCFTHAANVILRDNAPLSLDH